MVPIWCSLFPRETCPTYSTILGEVIKCCVNSGPGRIAVPHFSCPGAEQVSGKNPHSQPDVLSPYVVSVHPRGEVVCEARPVLYMSFWIHTLLGATGSILVEKLLMKLDIFRKIEWLTNALSDKGQMTVRQSRLAIRSPTPLRSAQIPPPSKMFLQPTCSKCTIECCIPSQYRFRGSSLGPESYLVCW